MQADSHFTSVRCKSSPLPSRPLPCDAVCRQRTMRGLHASGEPSTAPFCTFRPRFVEPAQPLHVLLDIINVCSASLLWCGNARTRKNPPAAHLSVPPCPSCHPRTYRAAAVPTQHRNRPHRVSHLLALRFSSDTTEPEERHLSCACVGGEFTRPLEHTRTSCITMHH
jgi:hypothetical protein